MNLDIYMLASQDRGSDFDGYTDLIATVQLLLQLSHSDFWNALGTMPPQRVAVSHDQTALYQARSVVPADGE